MSCTELGKPNAIQGPGQGKRLAYTNRERLPEYWRGRSNLSYLAVGMRQCKKRMLSCNGRDKGPVGSRRDTSPEGSLKKGPVGALGFLSSTPGSRRDTSPEGSRRDTSPRIGGKGEGTLGYVVPQGHFPRMGEGGNWA